MATRKKTTKIPSQINMPDWFSNTRLHCLLIFIFSFVLYANTLNHEYTQDDAIVIYDNEFTTQGIAGIPGILSYDTFRGFFKVDGKAGLVAGGRYRPLTLVMFAIEIEFFGESPFVGHLVNVLLYGLSGIVLYLLLLKLLLKKDTKQFAYWVALLTTLFFIAHPIHTEAVANIKGRDEIVALLGSLAAVYFSIRAFKEKKWGLNILAVAIFFLTLFAKENTITFLAVIPLAFWFFTNAKLKEIAVNLLPFIGAATLFLLIRNAVIGFQFGGTPMELMNNPFLKIEGNRYVSFSIGEKLATIFYTLGKYIQLLIFPHPLTHDYYPRQVQMMTFGSWQALLSVFLYIGLFIYAIKAFLKKNILGFGILFYLATLSVVSNIVFPVGTNMSERFVYMPSVGFCLIVAVLLYYLVERLSKGKAISFQKMYPAFCVGIGIVLLLSMKTISRNFVWKDNFTLFTTDVKVSTNSAKLQNAAGGELVTQSVKEKDEVKRQSMLKEAAIHLKEAIRIHPTYKNAYLLLGNCYNYQKEYDIAIQYYRQALKLDSDYTDAYRNMGYTYRDAGRYFGEQKNDLSAALRYLNEAIKILPNDYETLRLLGVATGIQGNNAKAIEYFIQATKAAPEKADGYWNLANAYLHIGDQENEQINRQKAISIDPNIAARYQKPQ